MTILIDINNLYDGFFPPIRAIRTRQYVYALAEEDARWLSFATWVEALQPHTHTPNPHTPWWPPAIAEALTPYVNDNTTWDELLDEMVVVAAYLPTIKKKKYLFDWESCEEVHQGKLLMHIIKPQLLIEGTLQHSLPDTTSRLVPKEWAEIVLRDDPLDKVKYVKELHDCDNFQLRFAARCAEEDLSPGAFGLVDVSLLTSEGEFLGAHALNFFVDTEGVFWFIEPQSDRIYPAHHVFRGMGGKDYQYYVYRLTLV